jgi:hypothetical protein
LGMVARLEIEIMATPVATNASAVRIHARAVRALAYENRGSGSSP